MFRDKKHKFCIKFVAIWCMLYFITWWEISNFTSRICRLSLITRYHMSLRMKSPGECILCKMLAFYICDWHWLVEDLRHNQFGPNSLNGMCIMILFMMKYYYNSRKYVTLTFEIWPWLIFDIWPWYLTLILIYYYLDASKKKLMPWRKKTRHF